LIEPRSRDSVRGAVPAAVTLDEAAMSFEEDAGAEEVDGRSGSPAPRRDSVRCEAGVTIVIADAPQP
jgi:hypothetical protein